MKKKANKIPARLANPKKAVAVVADGDTEQWYLDLMKTAEKLSYKVKPELPGKKTLQAEFEKVKTLISEEYDLVFWIIDVDVIHKENNWAELNQILADCKEDLLKDKVCVILNTPCLEFWYLLHFKDTAKYYSTYNELKKELTKYLKKYDKSKDYYYRNQSGIYQNLRQQLATAIVNAKKLPPYDHENPHTAQCGMYKIFEYFSVK